MTLGGTRVALSFADRVAADLTDWIASRFRADLGPARWTDGDTAHLYPHGAAADFHADRTAADVHPDRVAADVHDVQRAAGRWLRAAART